MSDSRTLVGGPAPASGRARVPPVGAGGDPWPAPRAGWVAFGVVAAAAVALRLGVAILHPNVLWPDEIHQSLEQAHRLVFGAGIVPWEFREGARSWILPGLLAGAMQLGRWGGGLGHVHAAQLLLCIVSVAPIAVAYAAVVRARGPLPALVAAIAVAFWFELVLFAPKALAEVVAAHLLILGLHLQTTASTSGRRLVVAGALLGAAVVLRVHVAPAVVLALAISVRRDWRAWRALSTGAAAVIALAGLVDLATWGRPFHSLVRTLQANVLEDKASQYGTSAWTGYLEAIGATWSWGTALLLPLAALGARLRPAFGACALAVLATHTAFAHKEYRFVYPAILLAVTLAAIGAGEVVAYARARARPEAAIAIAAAVLLAWAGTSAAGALRYETTVIDPATDAPESRWAHARWGLEAMALAGARPELCGVALAMLPWWWTGGYTYLHRDVPIYLLQEARDGPATAGGFNAVIAPADVVPHLPEFTVRRCWPGACLAERAGGCRTVPGEPINARLVTRGE